MYGLDEIFDRADSVFGKWLDYDIKRDALGLQSDTMRRRDNLSARYWSDPSMSGSSSGMVGIAIVAVLGLGALMLLRR